MYNFVLDRGHTLKINGIDLVTLGMGFPNTIVQHPYYATDRVIEDLKRIKGWNNGLIELCENSFKIEPTTK
jgi:hypothetical protein